MSLAVVGTLLWHFFLRAGLQVTHNEQILNNLQIWTILQLWQKDTKSEGDKYRMVVRKDACYKGDPNPKEKKNIFKIYAILN